ncbi:MAG TPA: flagellar hook-basal body complex protein FliE [Hyphomonadaceae bacterium]|nr:flagellar hook-basal body complex protein FliE [Hyphomonadaceae bacterium]
MSDLGVSAMKAYGATAQALSGNALKPDAGISGPGFGDILNTAVGSMTKAGAGAEGAITKAAMGKGDLVDVVTAVAAAEATMETVVAVRDEVIKAYNDIMRMPI